MNRRQFIACAAGVAAAGKRIWAGADDSLIDIWQKETDRVNGETFRRYMQDGDTRGFVSLEKLEAAFEKAVGEARTAKIGDVPGVWSIYNMGYLVKTKESFFAIDLVHRRASELADELDFALVTHNHNDHCCLDLYRKLNKSRKIVVSNFLDNYGVRDRKTGKWAGGFTRAEKVFRIRDCEVSTSLVDHNVYLLDFTTAFEIRSGKWKLYHTGDCGVAAKLKTRWGRPDLWTFFPGCGINVADAITRIRPKHLVFGHLWELGHDGGRLTAPLIRRARNAARRVKCEPSVALWGERIS